MTEITNADRSKAALRALRAAMAKMRITPGQRRAIVNNVTINAKPGVSPEDVARRIPGVYTSGSTTTMAFGGASSMQPMQDPYAPGKQLKLFYEFNDSMNRMIQRFGPLPTIEITRSWLAFYDKVTEVNKKMDPPKEGDL